MNTNLDSVECKEEASSLPSSLLYQKVYAEIEEVGWKHLVMLGDDLGYVSFKIMDRKGQAHIAVMHLPPSYPMSAPSVSADVPYVLELKWSTKSRLKDAVHQFREHLEKLQEFWSTLDAIDRDLWVVHPRKTSRASSVRKINLGEDCCALLNINAYDPRSLPECRFLGEDSMVDSMRRTWRRNSKKWSKVTPILENLAVVLVLMPPKPPDAQKNDQQVECGICYAHSLPVDEELGAKSGSGPDNKCDNLSCNRVFHSVCLGDWLHSLTTTRHMACSGSAGCCGVALSGLTFCCNVACGVAASSYTLGGKSTTMVVVAHYFANGLGAVVFLVGGLSSTTF